ncbi:hypothetical protein [Phenylobacterium sp.]|uniref:hypothetical protein n=1 Tax=Phenylobacterium sp. TaxID=1871053 RepID=UPI002DE6BE89|nr:hypothetical protein [Phenylobacterium sp.]
MTTEPIVTTGAISALIGGVGAFFTTLLVRRSKKAENAEVQVNLAGAFQKLCDELGEEVDRQGVRITELRADNHTLRNRISSLQQLVRLFEKREATLEAVILTLGGVVPDREPALAT